ncbi:MAG: serine hydrolase [Bacteroidetes bacterium]|nr:serine hydrolase [Bacteroidota bacterium]
MLSKKIQVYYILVAVIVTAIVTYFILKSTAKATAMPVATSIAENPDNRDCNTNIIRLHKYKYVNSILYTEKECESGVYNGLKEQIAGYVLDQKNAGRLTDASIYIRVYDGHGEWICVNPDVEYHPASLLKLTVLFTFATMAEGNPKLMDEKVLFKQHDATLPTPAFPDKSLTPGNSYTIRELLKYLIVYSDNDALYLLCNYHDPKVYRKTYDDLGVRFQDDGRDKSGMKVKEYSTLLRVLYNGSYLSCASSEYALSLLAQSDFKQGIMQGIPQGVEVAHKFGEYYLGNSCELHEAGVVYGPKNNYIITVMTRGNDMKTLSAVLGDISKMVYDETNPATK